MTHRSLPDRTEVLRARLRPKLGYVGALVRGWDRAIALLAALNFVLVVFNTTYIHWRATYLDRVPQLVSFYDPIRSISAHPTTLRYLASVDRLRDALDRGENLRDPAIEQRLENLRAQSEQLVLENPFAISDRMQEHGKLDRRLRDRLYLQSSREAWQTFWTANYLEQETPEAALAWFDAQLRPLLAANFTREIQPNGDFLDYFWRIDISFMWIFAVDILLRAIHITRTREELNFFDALLRRWYDLLLICPVYRWLRIVPTLARLQQANLVDFRRAVAQITHAPAAQLANRVSSFALLQIVDRTKEDIRAGKPIDAFIAPQDNYVRIGAADKVDRTIDLALQLALVRILPRLEPDITSLLKHNLEGTVQESGLYRSVANIPGMQGMPSEAIAGFATTLAQATCQGLADAYQDEDGRVLFETFSENFKEALRDELRDERVRAELEQAMVEILEEIELNYIKGVSEQDPEETLSEVDRIMMAEAPTASSVELAGE
ncbi:MAG: hypothetical protein ACFB9N_09880 [Geitlerinemataceae cyanobacterium]